MSNMKQGTIEFFNPAGKKVGNRGSVAYSFKMDDGEWYSCGFDSPGDLGVGDQVKFENVQNSKGYWNVNLDTLKVKKNKNPVSTAKKAAGGKENYDARAKYWEDKEVRDLDLQKRIGYAGAINSALTFATILASSDAFPVTAAKLKKPEGVDAAQEVIGKLADEFYLRINTRPFELDEVVTPEVVGKEELEATEKEEEKDDEDDDWGDV